jgi:cytochrome P450
MEISEYDPFSAIVKENPYRHYEWLRTHAPVYHNERLDIWVLSRYRDVWSALRNHEVFSSAEGFGPERVRATMMIYKDPPEHDRLRGLASQAFTPKMIARKRPQIERTTHDLIHKVIEMRSFDLVRDLAEPLPLLVIGQILGVDSGILADLKRWSDDAIAVVGSPSPSTITQYLNSWKEYKSYFTGLIEKRRTLPEDDLITALVSTERSSDPLTINEILNFCLLLLIAGNETTTNLIANGGLALMNHYDQARRLCAEPGLIPSAVEECLRYDSPVQGSFRTNRTEIEINGVSVPRASKVMMLYASANRDAEQFTEPDRFDVKRSPNNHIGLGSGIHFCLGAPLARLEASIVIEEICRSMKNVHLDPDKAPSRVDNPLFRGFKSLPLLFDRK